ncbi:MAG: hypothetical protein Q9196_005972 [Gyalolechia fulgens]
MVRTRSQDRDRHGESQPLPGRDTPVPSSDKRKNLSSAAVVATSSSGTKRRKLNGAPSKPDNDTPKTFSAVLIPTTTPDPAMDQERNSSEGIDLSSYGSEYSPPIGGHALQCAADTESQQKSGGSRPAQTPQGHDESTADTQPSPVPTIKEPLSARSNADKSPRRDARVEVTSLVDPLSPASSHTELNSTKSQHKRFDGEEAAPAPPIFPDLPPEMRAPIEDSEVEPSDDEAPEVVAQSKGLEKVRSAAAGTAKAIEAQRAGEKQKRKERNELLERQAKATKKEAEERKSKNIRPRMSTDDEKTDHSGPSPADPPAGFEWSSKDSLPQFLPDEILAAEPMLRLPTPSPESLVVQAPFNKKQKFLEEKSRQPKDVRRGNTRIRVLEERQATLAPKVSKSSRTIRESWLAGRSGAKGRVVMERRKMGGGFVRK